MKVKFGKFEIILVKSYCKMSGCCNIDEELQTLLKVLIEIVFIKLSSVVDLRAVSETLDSIWGPIVFIFMQCLRKMAKILIFSSPES